VIESPTSGAGAVSRGAEAAEVSLNRTLGVTTLTSRRPADGTCAARMTSVNVSQRMHELSDGMMRLFSATKAGGKRFILEILGKANMVQIVELRRA